MSDDYAKTQITSGFTTACEQGQWSIVLSGMKIDLNLEEKGYDGMGWADGLLSFINHNYIEIREPCGTPFRRIQAQEADMKSSGRMLGASYGSEGTPFIADQIYHDNPHETVEHMLEFGLDNTRTSAVFSGTKEQVMTLYHQALEAVIELNNQDLEYSGGQNGNTFTSEVLEHIVETAHAYNLTVKDFDPAGWDMAFDVEKLSTSVGGRIQFESITELEGAIATLENLASGQFQAIKADTSVDLDTKIPKEAKLDENSPTIIKPTGL